MEVCGDKYFSLYKKGIEVNLIIREFMSHELESIQKLRIYYFTHEVFNE